MLRERLALKRSKDKKAKAGLRRGALNNIFLRHDLNKWGAKILVEVSEGHNRTGRPSNLISHQVCPL